MRTHGGAMRTEGRLGSTSTQWPLLAQMWYGATQSPTKAYE